MNLAEKIDILLANNLTQTEFSSIPVKASLITGTPIGLGACKAVILRLNLYERNSTKETVQAVEQIYYGDSTGQEFELLRGQDSEIIFCNALEDVFVRTPTDCIVQVLAYKGYPNLP